MRLSEFNSVLDAIVWLTNRTRVPWTWKDVLKIFSETSPETITVNVSPGAKLISQYPTDKDEIFPLGNPKYLQVCHVEEFLEHILMGDDFESACATPLSLVLNNIRYSSIVPIKASAIRLTRYEIYQIEDHLSLEPFDVLVNELNEGKHQNLTALLQNDCPTVAPHNEPNTESSRNANLHKSKPEPLMRAQERLILEWLAKNDYDAQNLPKDTKGKSGVKAIVLDALGGEDAFKSKTAFKRAWERLSANKQIKKVT